MRYLVHKLRLQVILTPIFFGVGVAPSAAVDCGRLDRYGYVEGRLGGYAIQKGEKNFAEMYNFRMRLPVSEKVFLDFVKSERLSIDVLALGKNAACSALPQLKKIKDLEIQKVYLITDMTTLGTVRGVHFAAYVTNSGDVSYVENRFEYVGP